MPPELEGPPPALVEQAAEFEQLVRAMPREEREPFVVLMASWVQQRCMELLEG